MKILGKSYEIDGLEIKRSKRKENGYWEIQKDGKVGHVNKEIPLFENAMDAEEWIKDNFVRVKWGSEGLDEDDLIYLYSGDINIFKSSKEDLKSILNRILKTVEDHDDNGIIGDIGRNFNAILQDDIQYNLKTKVIEMRERSKDEKDAYWRYKSIKSSYKKEMELLGGSIFSVAKLNIYLFSALTILLIYLGVLGYAKTQVDSQGMWPTLIMMSIILLPISIPMLIQSIKKYREILHAKKELKFIVNTVV